MNRRQFIGGVVAAGVAHALPPEAPLFVGDDLMRVGPELTPLFGIPYHVDVDLTPWLGIRRAFDMPTESGMVGAGGMPTTYTPANQAVVSTVDDHNAEMAAIPLRDTAAGGEKRGALPVAVPAVPTVEAFSFRDWQALKRLFGHRGMGSAAGLE